MRKIFAHISLFLLISCSSGSQNEEGTFAEDAGYIQVVLFHMQKRCESCDAVELETLKLLDEEYAEELNSGIIKFIPLNYQSENGKRAAEILRATGQTLYVVKGERVSNLTSAAFMYAHTHPSYYTDVLRRELDQYLE